MTLPTPTPAPDSFRGRRIAVVGLGIEGCDAIALLEREGADIIPVDRNPCRAKRSPDDLSLLNQVVGIVASQGVHYQTPLLAEAERRGTPVYGPMQLFLERCPAKIIGITGSAGKTTTATLTHQLLQASGIRSHIGGNIGQGLLAQLPNIEPSDTVVAEISHTQLLRTTRSPHIAAITNITPNHLDQFSWNEYQQLKFRIARSQIAADTIVLPTDDALAATAASLTPAGVRWFGLGQSPHGTETANCAVRCMNGHIVRNGHTLIAASELRIPGPHNLLNALAALAIVGDHVSDRDAADVLRSFSGVPHRLELVAVVDGVQYINDSIGSTPERTLAGLRAITGQVILMLGGRDKRLPLDPLLPELQRCVRRVLLFGEAAPGWSAWLSRHGVDAVQAGDLRAAFQLATKIARPGETVLMSPSGTSFDAYSNFEARGQHFRDLVHALQGEHADRRGATS